MFEDPLVEMHYQLLLLWSDRDAQAVAPFQGWDPDWEAKREALVAKMSPEEQQWTREIDAKLEEKRRRRGRVQWNWRNS